MAKYTPHCHPAKPFKAADCQQHNFITCDPQRHAHQHRIILQAIPANSLHARKGQALILCALLLLQKRYLAVGPDAVLTSSHKGSSVNRLHPSLPTSPRRTPRGPTGPKSPRKTPAATPRSILPPVPETSCSSLHLWDQCIPDINCSPSFTQSCIWGGSSNPKEEACGHSSRLR